MKGFGVLIGMKGLIFGAFRVFRPRSRTCSKNKGFDGNDHLNAGDFLAELEEILI